MRPTVRQSLCTALFAMGTLVVLILMYIPIVRVHQGWEDEIFWFSTCLSMLRHHKPIPSVLQDFSGTRSPLYFYGPTLFWAGTLMMKIFGATVRSWRSLGFAGNVAFLAAVAFLFRSLRRSYCATMIAVFVFSLSVGSSFGFSLPGRLDAWTLAFIVLALAIAAKEEHADPPQTMAGRVLRWMSFGILIGFVATTTPRCWPFLFFLLATFPLLVEKHRARSLLIAAIGCLGAGTLLLLPLHTTLWGHLVYVRQASSNDKVNISPLLGGSWGFGHSSTQIIFYGAVLVILALLCLPFWAKMERFGRWLLCAGLLNLAVSMLLVSRALNMSTYWAFPLEIAAMMGLTRFAEGGSARFARVLGILLLVFMAALRIGRELPVFMHWAQRDPVPRAQAIAAAIPPASLVYGPVGQYFYPTFESGSDYRYLTERTTPGLSSVPDRIDTQTPMSDACHRAAYLVWPTGDAAEPLPILPRATMRRVADHSMSPQRPGRFEQMMEKVPGGRSDIDDEGFAVYRLQMDPQYCGQR